MRLWFHPCIGKISWRRKWQSTPVFSPEESHGQGAWWATVHGAAKSCSQLKLLGTAWLLYICLSVYLYSSIFYHCLLHPLSHLSFSHLIDFFLITVRTMSQRTCLENKHRPTPHRVCEGFCFFGFFGSFFSRKVSCLAEVQVSSFLSADGGLERRPGSLSSSV